MGYLTLEVSPKTIEWGQSFDVYVRWSGDYDTGPNVSVELPPLNERKVRLLINLIDEHFNVIVHKEYPNLDPIYFEKHITLHVPKSKMPKNFHGEMKAKLSVTVQGLMYITNFTGEILDKQYLNVQGTAETVYIRDLGYKPEPPHHENPQPIVDNPYKEKPKKKKKNPPKTKKPQESITNTQPIDEEGSKKNRDSRKKLSLIALVIAAISIAGYLILKKR